MLCIKIFAGIYCVFPFLFFFTIRINFYRKGYYPTRHVLYTYIFCFLFLQWLYFCNLRKQITKNLYEGTRCYIRDSMIQVIYQICNMVHRVLILLWMLHNVAWCFKERCIYVSSTSRKIQDVQRCNDQRKVVVQLIYKTFPYGGGGTRIVTST